MKTLRALLILGRVSNLPTIWSNCLCGWLIGVGYAGIGPVDWSMLYWLCAGASAIYLGGMYLNDACDVAFDRQFRKERPIPSGVISEGAVWKMGIGLLAAGVGVLSLQGGATALLALALFNCVLIYNFLHKKIAWSPLLIALCRFFLLLLAASFAFVTTNPDGSFFAHQNSGLATWTALVLCLYVTGLSCLAKVESEPGEVRYWPCILLCSPLLLALFLNPSGENRKDALLVSAILGLWIIRCLRSTFWEGKRDVGKTIGGLLAGISLVDLLAVHLVSTELAGLFLGCFLLSLAAQRWVPAT
ncbi:MAG: UbiA family prenyltransferase [Verrucomicrobiota bacterium]|nr:UbiA family prenyltransferase [Verrucomicrobiota bacterium]